MDLVVEVYKLTNNFPKTELYGLTSQMRRCSVSIPSNIAEGRTRGTRKDFRHFLILSYSSGGELETQVELSKRLSFLDISKYQKLDSLLSEVMKMLNKMISSLN